jgi:hypothetical protein
MTYEAHPRSASINWRKNIDRSPLSGVVVTRFLP